MRLFCMPYFSPPSHPPPLASEGQALQEESSYVLRLPETAACSAVTWKADPEGITPTRGRLYRLFTLLSLLCWQSPAEVTVSQPTHTANGTNG